MADQKRLVLDANILVSCIFGIKARSVVENFSDLAALCTPITCVGETERNITRIAKLSRLNPSTFQATFARLLLNVEVIEHSALSALESSAARRIPRGPSDWPIIAAAMLLDCPIWTEDRDFFGCGIATWTTNTVELSLQDG